MCYESSMLTKQIYYKMNSESIISESRFSMLEGKIDDRILKGISSLGFEKPTKIQAESLPYLLMGRDLIAAAKTGSGKTLAFLIPILQNLIKHGFLKKKSIGCIILSPTRELALQTFQILQKLASDIDLSHCLIVGGENKAKDIQLLKKGVNIIVSTPGRLLDHMQNAKMDYSSIKCFVLDEADKLLDAGFERYIKVIVKMLPSDRQTILLSATMDDKVEKLSQLVLNDNPISIAVRNNKPTTVQGLQHGYYLCPMERKISWLYKMLKKTKKLKVMVFFSSCRSVDFHYKFFKTHCKASILCLHGRKSQSKRKLAYKIFIEADSGTLFCTDVAARGLDIPHIDWVIQYDPPIDHKEYIHRVGRTARGENNTGNAVLLLTPEEEELVVHLRKKNIQLDKYSFSEPNQDIQNKLEELIETNGVMKTTARKAYLAYLRCYSRYPLKKIFNLQKIDLEGAAKAFGFRVPPDVDFVSKRRKKKSIEEEKAVTEIS